ncbi:CBS domain-containing protein [Nocardiopsis aegyptia]|uniref:CBS domain-containing protein n=1 Tax=Nocardiopsis aegyptia TaxID=220378 RepID=A0A7Z0ELW3_9ACTN|nr:CBS domain-containing protein [Nocardiopsis aegyptia]NYJ34505.1 CBS domain-containing protein [Nocardiopsis aegyptia]
MRTVRDVMTTEVFSVAEETDYRETAEQLIERRVSAMPVTDGEGHVVGVVSEEDLLHKEEFAGGDYWPPLRARLRARLGSGGSAGAKAAARNAAELMTSPAVTVGPEASVVLAARLMERRGVKRLPVVDEAGRLIGIVSRRDLLSVFVKEDDDIVEEARKEITALLPRPAVSVEDGVVRLSGELEHRSDVEKLIHRVSQIEGVVAVDPDLRWHADDVVPQHVQWRAASS